jgi:serine/threonine-protein kinase
VTITVIQGQGTALYTPLEQYGGDDAHTDVRADIFSFGATLYHLLTNEPPTEARKRFLDTQSLTPLRKINPNISLRVDKAVLWAMALHPDDRPKNVVEFREALLGKHDAPQRAERSRASYQMSAQDFVTEQIAGYVAAGLFLLGLAVTLTR